MTAQSLFEYVQKVLHFAGTDDDTWAAIDAATRKVARAYAWIWLRRTKSITQIEDATSGTLMPANMIDVIDPIIDSDQYVYHRIDASQVQEGLTPSESKRYFFFDAGAISPLVEAQGVSIDKNTTALTFSPALPSGTYAGEFIRLQNFDGKDCGLYELASNTNLVRTYRGPKISNGYYLIRPSHCRRLSFADGDGERIAASTTVHYWVYPAPVLGPQDELPDHWEEVLRLAAAIEVTTETVDKRGLQAHSELKNEYERALGRARARDGQPPMSNIARDNRGYVRRFGWR